MRKTIIALILVALLSFAACSSQTPDPSESTPDSSTEATTEAAPEATDASDPKQADKDALAEKIGRITFREDLPGDKTGNWRVALINYDGDILEHVLDYYKAYFTSDEEVHFLVNQADDRTVRINAYGTTLLCTVLERVDGGDFNALMVNTGDELSSYQITVETGEVKQLS